MLVIIGMLAALILPTLSHPEFLPGREPGSDGWKVRSIGHAILAETAANPDALTTGDLYDVYGLAWRLAKDNTLTDPQLWFSAVDKNFKIKGKVPDIYIRRASGEVGGINPEFHGAPLAIAVALFPTGTNLLGLPATTPLAWTRGLQPDGTWSKSLGTNGDVGGYIVFLNGSTAYFKGNVGDRLTSYRTEKHTSNIQEALPPGTRISEFRPGK